MEVDRHNALLAG